MTISNFTIAEIIELGILILAVVGLFLKLSKDKTSIDVQINENRIRILTLEKDMLALKSDYTAQVNDTRIEFAKIVSEFKKENREDHGKVFDKIVVIGEAVAKVAASFESHILTERQSFISPRDIK